MYKTLTIKWKQLLVHIWRNTVTQQTTADRIGSMVTHFQLPPYEYHWATRQARDIARDIAISANSPCTWFFSKEQLCGQYRTSFRNYPAQNRVEMGRLLTCGFSNSELASLETNLKGKHEIFLTELIILGSPIWTGDLGSTAKNWFVWNVRVIFAILFFYRLLSMR